MASDLLPQRDRFLAHFVLLYSTVDDSGLSVNLEACIMFLARTVQYRMQLCDLDV